MSSSVRTMSAALRAAAEVGGADGRGVVGAVPDHPDHPARVPQGLDDLELLLGRDPGHDSHVAQHPGPDRPVRGRQFVARDHGGVVRPAQFGGDRPGGLRVVTGQHDRSYARLAQPPHQGRGRLTRYIRQRHQAGELQALQRLFEEIRRILALAQRALGHRQDAQAVAGQRLRGVGRVGREAGAGGQDGFRGTFDHQHRRAVRAVADGSGVSAAGLERTALGLYPVRVGARRVEDRLVGRVHGPVGAAVDAGACPGRDTQGVAVRRFLRRARVRTRRV
jgi:hypothetical protein